jgi:ABC-type phosphate/phosphonate transport system substrate-binding protein
MGYVNFMDNRNIRAVLERFSDPPKRSIFVVRKEDNIRNIADLKNKRIAFKSKYSLPGYLLPLQELSTFGFDPTGFFQQESFSENYSNSLLGLLNNEFDCIVIASNFLMELPDSQKENIKIIHESKPLPGGVYIARKDRRMSFEQIVTGNFMKLSETLSSNEMFAGMFKVKHPDEEAYRSLAREFGHGK